MGRPSGRFRGGKIFQADGTLVLQDQHIYLAKKGAFRLPFSCSICLLQPGIGHVGVAVAVHLCQLEPAHHGNLASCRRIRCLLVSALCQLEVNSLGAAVVLVGDDTGQVVLAGIQDGAFLRGLVGGYSF